MVGLRKKLEKIKKGLVEKQDEAIKDLVDLVKYNAKLLADILKDIADATSTDEAYQHLTDYEDVATDLDAAIKRLSEKIDYWKDIVEGATKNYFADIKNAIDRGELDEVKRLAEQVKYFLEAGILDEIELP